MPSHLNMNDVPRSWKANLVAAIGKTAVRFLTRRQTRRQHRARGGLKFVAARA